jgi:hypothetical protein
MGLSVSVGHDVPAVSLFRFSPSAVMSYGSRASRELSRPRPPDTAVNRDLQPDLLR